jgi:hypothetical protein
MARALVIETSCRAGARLEERMADPLHDRPDEKARRERDPDSAVEQMEKVLEQGGGAGEELPPVREQYGGPREASDGTRVSPDGARPRVPTSGSAREGTPTSGQQGHKAAEEETPDKTPGQGGPL